MKAASIAKWVYNPSRIPKDEFLQRFVARGQEFRLIWRDIGTSELGKVEQHYLITGQRGMGKTSLMLKLAYEIENSKELKDWLLPVVFPEELFGVPTLDDLWMKTAEILEETYPQYFEGVQDEVLDHADHPGYAIAYIRSLLAQKGKKLVLFIDNFGDLLDRFPENDIRTMRAVMMGAHDLRMVAGSARVLDHTFSYDKPFFDFFNVVSLKSLDAEQAFEMMRQLAACSANPEEMVALVEARKARIEGIRRLTGGVPRNLMLLFGMIAEDPEQGFLPALEQILDGATPYFKHRVEELGKQQQQILHHVAMAWDAIGAGEIADKMHEDSKKVSAQLRQMLDNDLLERVETGTKNHLYRLKERFFNIWYLMRMAGQRDLARMRWLVEFLKGWLERPELQERMGLVRDALEAGGQFTDASYVNEELANLLAEQQEAAIQYYPEEDEDEPDPNGIILRDPGVRYLTAAEMEFDPELIPYNIRIRDASSWKEAMDAFGEINRNGLRPDVVSFNTLLSKVPNWEEAMRLWEQAEVLGIKPNVVSFNTLLSKALDWDEALAVWEQADTLGIEPNVISFATLLSKAPNWGEVMAVWDQAKGLGIEPNVVSFNALLSKAPNWNEALAVWEQAEDLSIEPNVVSFNTLLSKAPNWDDALAVWEQAEGLGIVPDVVSFTTLLFKAPNWDEAMAVWDQAKGLGIEPNVVSFTTLLSKAPNWDEAQATLKQMHEDGITPNIITFNTLWGKCDTYSDSIILLDQFSDPSFLDARFAHLDRKGTLPLQRASWYLWHQGLGDYHLDAIAYFKDTRPKGPRSTWQEFYLLLLIIKRQRQAAMALFEESPYQLKEVFKPLYYALLKIWGPDKALEVLRMPPEIESTVDEVVAFIREMQEKYRT
jgi:tetratricopeptide (TPR) repeat protein